jgi:copper chaperone CopZ
MSVNGVASVDVSLDKALAAVKLKPGNSVTLKQLQGAITKNGLTIKQSRLTAARKMIPA